MMMLSTLFAMLQLVAFTFIFFASNGFYCLTRDMHTGMQSLSGNSKYKIGTL